MHRERYCRGIIIVSTSNHPGRYTARTWWYGPWGSANRIHGCLLDVVLGLQICRASWWASSYYCAACERMGETWKGMVVLVETCQDYNLVRVDHGESRAAGPFPPFNRRRGGGTSLKAYMCFLVVGESKKRHPRHENTIMMKMDNNTSTSYSLDKKQTSLPTSRRWNKSRQITVYVGFGCCRGGVATELARGALHVPLSRVSKKMRLTKFQSCINQSISSRHIFRDCTCARREAFPSFASFASPGQQ